MVVRVPEAVSKIQVLVVLSVYVLTEIYIF